MYIGSFASGTSKWRAWAMRGSGQMIGDQRRECNREFGRFVEQHYTPLG